MNAAVGVSSIVESAYCNDEPLRDTRVLEAAFSKSSPLRTLRTQEVSSLGHSRVALHMLPMYYALVRAQIEQEGLSQVRLVMFLSNATLIISVNRGGKMKSRVSDNEMTIPLAIGIESGAADVRSHRRLL